MSDPVSVGPDQVIENIIDAFHKRTQATAALAETQLKHARENQSRYISEIANGIGTTADTLKDAAGNAFKLGRATNQLVDATKLLESVTRFPHEQMLSEIIFTSLFSNLDAYMNNLLHAMFARNPRLLNTGAQKEGGEEGDQEQKHAVKKKDEQRKIAFNELLNRTKEEIIASMIDKEVDALLRKSYVESFDRLAKKFKAGTLTKFPNWSRFVECSQRRNLVTHCGAVVNKQYLDICKQEKVQLSKDATLGEKLVITKEYLLDAIQIVTETGIKLGQVLWRTFGKGAIYAADRHLVDLMFELLKREEWSLASRFGEFGQTLAKRSYEEPRSEQALKAITINHAQAAKWSGDNDGALRIVKAADWSGSSIEFPLAVACIKEDWAEAARLMRQIGKNYERLPVHAYIGWPIFRGFRETDEFPLAFREVFGVEFADEAKKEASESLRPSSSTSTENANANGSEEKVAGAPDQSNQDTATALQSVAVVVW